MFYQTSQSLTLDPSWNESGPRDGEAVMVQLQLFNQRDVILKTDKRKNITAANPAPKSTVTADHRFGKVLGIGDAIF